MRRVKIGFSTINLAMIRPEGWSKPLFAYRIFLTGLGKMEVMPPESNPRTTMTEKEATQYVNLTVRTLRNYRSSGKLPYREVPGKTRPAIEYERADLDQLKAVLAARHVVSAKPRKGQPPLPRVTFGLPLAEYDELVRAAKKVGMTPGEYARRRTREQMESRYMAEAKDLRAELAAAKAEMRKIHKEFSAAFEAVLEYSGLSSDAAKKWVDDNLR